MQDEPILAYERANLLAQKAIIRQMCNRYLEQTGRDQMPVDEYRRIAEIVNGINA